MTEPTVIIKNGREKPILQQHPWIFSGAIDRVKDNPNPGDIVTVIDQTGRFLGRGYWNPRSQIQVRLLTWHDEPIDEAWWRRMLQRAIQTRYLPGRPEHNVAHRIVHAESDYLPGLILDRYSDFLVLQALTLHIDQHKAEIAQLAVDLFQEAGMPMSGVYERSDVDVRGKEGLKTSRGVLWGEEPPEWIEFAVEKQRRLVDVRHGHKTGYYLDQIGNHQRLADWIAHHYPDPGACSMLNAFSFSGGFGIATPAHITNVDASEEALMLAERTYQHNQRPPERAEFIQADVFDLLRDFATEKKQFDVVVLDPPKFAHNAGQVDNAARGYKDINLNAFHCVKPGGYLMTFSCSGAITPDLFQKIVFGALADSGRQAQIIEHLGPGHDHPVALTFPEGAYLKGLLLKVY